MGDQFRVAVFTRATHRHSTGGMAIAAWNIARALADQRHDVVLYTTRTASFSGPYPESGVLCHYLDGTEPCVYDGGYYRQAALAFERDHCGSRRFDAIVSISKAARDAIAIPGAPPALFTSHGIGLDRVQDELNIAVANGVPANMAAVQNAITATHFDRVSDIGCSEQQFYWKWTALGGVSLSACMDLQTRIAHPRVFFVPNPVYDVDWTNDPPTHGKPARSPMQITICAGNLLAANKGVATVIPALARMPDVLVTLVGAGGDSLAQKLPHVHNYGHVAHGVALDLIARSDVVLDPSLHHSGLNMVVAQALSLGVPVVAYPFGGMSTAITSGENGYLVRPGDPDALIVALERVRTNRAEMSMDARSHARLMFSPAETGVRYSMALRTMIAGHVGYPVGPRGWW